MVIQKPRIYGVVCWNSNTATYVQYCSVTPSQGYPDKGTPDKAPLSLSLYGLYSTVMWPALYGHNLMSTVRQTSCLQS